jgi:hypothetical protein
MGLNGMWRVWRGVAQWVGRGFTKRVTAMVRRALVDRARRFDGAQWDAAGVAWGGSMGGAGFHQTSDRYGSKDASGPCG